MLVTLCEQLRRPLNPYCPYGGDCVYRTASATAANATGSDQAESLSSQTPAAAMTHRFPIKPPGIWCRS
jgi:hypothetical protein